VRVTALAGAVAVAGALALTGCSSSSSSSPASAAAASTSVSMATSLSTLQDTWAVLPMAANPAFWEVFVRPVNSTSWKLVTPPGVADNGGLVVSAGGQSSLSVAFRPSQDLLFSPLAATANGGASWSAGPPLDAAVAASPDAFAADGANLVALLTDGAVETSADSGTTWSVIAKPGAIAASPAGKGCGGAVRVTSVSFGPTGTGVLAGGTCGTSGTAAEFSYTPGAGWQRVRLPVSGQLERLTDAMALVLGRSGLSALWRGAPAAGTGQQSWITSAALPVSGSVVASGDFAVPGVPTAFEPAGVLDGAGAWVLLSGGRAATIGAPEGTSAAAPQWVLLPPVPAHTSVLASGPDGSVDALAASGTTLTVWRLATDATVWSKVQAISVPIQFGSSS
jgi:hypothetical protein